MKRLKLALKKGFTLTEVLLVIAIAFLIIGVMFVIYIKVSDNYKITRETNFLDTLKTNVINYYTTMPSYSTITPSLLISNNMIDSNQITDSSTIKDYLGSSFDVEPYYHGSGFTFIINGISASACNRLLPQVAKSFSIINESTDTINAETINPSNTESYCSSGVLTLTYSTKTAPLFDTGIVATTMVAKSFPTINKANGNPISANNTINFASLNNQVSGFDLLFTESNSNTTMYDYLMKTLDMSSNSSMNSGTSSTGYTVSGCSAYPEGMDNIGGCGKSNSLNLDSFLNAIANAPDSVIDNSNFTIVLDSYTNNVKNAICSKLTCTVAKNANGINQIYITTK